MKVKVYFKSGNAGDFLVPAEILAIDMFKMFISAGGPIQKIEFP